MRLTPFFVFGAVSSLCFVDWRSTFQTSSSWRSAQSEPSSSPSRAPVSMGDRIRGAYSCFASGRRNGKCRGCTREYEKEKRSRQRRARSSVAYQQAREVALRAAGYRCVKCGSSEQVETHHAVLRPHELGANNQANLIVLCQRCHIAQHSRPITKPRERFSRQKLTGQ